MSIGILVLACLSLAGHGKARRLVMRDPGKEDEVDQLLSDIVAAMEAQLQTEEVSALDDALESEFVTHMEHQLNKAKSKTVLKEAGQSELDPQNLPQFNEAFIKAARAGELFGPGFVRELEAQLDGEERKIRFGAEKSAAEPSDLDPQKLPQFNQAFLTAARAGHLFGSEFVKDLEAQLEGEERSERFETEDEIEERSDLDPRNWPKFNEEFIKAAREGGSSAHDWVAEFEAQLTGEELSSLFEAEDEKAAQSDLDPQNWPQFNKEFVKAARAGQLFGSEFVKIFEAQLEGEKRSEQFDEEQTAEHPKLDPQSWPQFNEAFINAARAGYLLGPHFVADLEARLDEVDPRNKRHFQDAFVKAVRAAKHGSDA